MILFSLMKMVCLEQEASLADAACFIQSKGTGVWVFLVFPPWLLETFLSLHSCSSELHIKTSLRVVQPPPEICGTLLFLVNFGIFKHDLKSSVL